MVSILPVVTIKGFFLSLMWLKINSVVLCQKIDSKARMMSSCGRVVETRLKTIKNNFSKLVSCFEEHNCIRKIKFNFTICYLKIRIPFYGITFN